MSQEESSQPELASDPVVDSPVVADVAPEAPSEPSAPRSIKEIASALESAATSAAVIPEATAPVETAASEPPPPSGRQARAKYTLQGALDLVRTLRSQGRDAEIPPEALGMVRAYDADVVARHTAELDNAKALRSTYLEQLALEATDPAAALRAVRAQPKLAEFMDLYARENPDVSLDSPDAAPLQKVDPKQMRTEIDGEYRAAFGEFAASLAEEFEIPLEKMTEIGAKGLGPFGVLNDLIQVAIDHRVEAEVAKELPKRLADEAKAIRLEEQARYASKTIITPRYVPGGTPGESAQPTGSAPPTMREAAERAQRLIAAR